MPDTEWIGVQGEYPDNPEFLPMQTLFEVEPYPLAAFRQDDLTNRGYPYLVIFPDLEKITLNPVKQRDYICVYDMLSEKADFLTNGLAILHPTSAIIREVMNGEYSLTLEHPIDDSGKWKYIRESNIIKCQGQLFTVKRVEWNHTSMKSGTVTAYCEHIFYQLNDLWIFGEENREPEKFTYCKNAMDSIMSRYSSYDTPEMYRYSFDWDSDWTFQIPWTLIIDGSGQTPVEKLIGSGGIIDEKGGELYRNNFHFSINERMENAEDNAFDLRFGADLCGLKRTVDTSTLALWQKLTDEETGFWYAISYNGDNFPLFQFPHNILRSKTIRYEQDFYDWFWDAVYSGRQSEAADAMWDRLYADLFASWKNTSAPVIYYELSVKDLKEIYPELTGHYQYKVGNSGRVYDEILGGAVTLKITETEVNGITGEVTNIVVGSKNSFTRGAGYPLELNGIQPSGVEYEAQMRDSRGLLLYDSRGQRIMIRGDM